MQDLDPSSAHDAAGRGDSASDEVIVVYRETVAALYAFVLRRVGGSRALAEDITQETYLRAVKAWGDGRLPDQPLAWLQTVARNLLSSYYRRRRPAAVDAGDIDHLLDRGEQNGSDAAALVYWGLTRLGRRRASVLEAFYIDGKSTQSIAEEMGITSRAVEGRLRRARAALKRELKPILKDNGVMP